MAKFIISALIDQRKKVLLDLLPILPGVEPNNSIEDQYIVELKDSSRKLIAIEKSKLIQSLVRNQRDLQFSELQPEFNWDDNAKKLTVKFSVVSLSGNNPVQWNNIPSRDMLQVEKDLYLSIHNNEHVFSIDLDKGVLYNGNKEGQIKIEIQLACQDTLVNQEITYRSVIEYFYAEPSLIRMAGLDFGSEATQLAECEPGELKVLGFNLFSAIKNLYYQNGAESNPYVQQDDVNTNLFRSIFYSKRKIKNTTIDSRGVPKIEMREHLNVITPTNGRYSTKFIEEWVLVPNLKLIRDNSVMGSAINFEVSSSTSTSNSQSITLDRLKDNIYAALMEGMIKAFYLTRIKSPCYLRFTLLVPNIYNSVRIKTAKKTIREAFEAINTQSKGLIKGLELTLLSESDASFMGCQGLANFLPDHFYIIIDVGKGTTDFSILKSDSQGKTFSSEYRNGFAGAGNLISFAMYRGFIDFLRTLQIGGNQYLERYIEDYLLAPQNNPFKQNLYENIERWKVNYDSGLDENQVRQSILDIKDGQNSLLNIFGNIDELANASRTFYQKIESLYDWNGHIMNNVHYISDRLKENLEPVLEKLSKKGHKCGGVLLTGRGCNFKPLRIAIETSLKSISSLGPNTVIINTGGIDLKAICMNGIFNQSIITNVDILSTPIEFTAGADRPLNKKNLPASNVLQKILNVFMRLIPSDGFDFYSEADNSVEVLNRNLLNCEFRAGGSAYTYNGNVPGTIQKAHLVQSREGLHIIVELENEKREVYGLTLNQAGNVSDNKAIFKSMLPGYFDRSTL